MNLSPRRSRRSQQPGRHSHDAAPALPARTPQPSPDGSRIRPAVAGSRPPVHLLAQVREGLRDLDTPPAARIRAYGYDRTQPVVQADLRGLPNFAGIGTDDAGRLVAWLNLGRLDDEGDLVLAEAGLERLEQLASVTWAAIEALRQHWNGGAA
jgi:hypothetical protein